MSTTRAECKGSRRRHLPAMSSSTTLLLLLALAARVISVASVTVIVQNEFAEAGKQLDVHCRRKNGLDYGVQTIPPFTNISWSFTTGFLGLDKLTCTFMSIGKPFTTIDVYEGFMYSKPPCMCRIRTCLWQVLDAGFWCNHVFVEGWV